ncbi:MAG: VOC family protein [Spongiibacteraceae bacterium]|jgi:catechol 2,3-dioxygenase-like lactoylglutathione lyase family enzyme|nr:VOC family protein [Spongiibacteraceae bacterium]
MSIYTHITVGTNNVEKAREFYDKVLGTIGLKRLADIPEGRGSIWGIDEPAFFALTPANGEPATFGNGVTISFKAKDRASVEAFHRTALELGGRDEGAAGPRKLGYAAYVRDLDGNKLAVYGPLEG